MDWRSENWEDKRNQWLNAIGGKFADPGETMDASVPWEAGADAILNALRGVHSLEGIDRMIEVILKPEVATIPIKESG